MIDPYLAPKAFGAGLFSLSPSGTPNIRYVLSSPAWRNTLRWTTVVRMSVVPSSKAPIPVPIDVAAVVIVPMVAIWPRTDKLTSDIYLDVGTSLQIAVSENSANQQNHRNDGREFRRRRRKRGAKDCSAGLTIWTSLSFIGFWESPLEYQRKCRTTRCSAFLNEWNVAAASSCAGSLYRQVAAASSCAGSLFRTWKVRLLSGVRLLLLRGEAAVHCEDLAGYHG